MLQDYVDVDDKMKLLLKDVYCNVADLSLSRATQLRQSLLVSG